MRSPPSPLCATHSVIIKRGSDTFEIPDRLPVLPLRDVVAFPYVVMPLLIGRQASLNAAQVAWESHRFVLLIAQRDASTLEPKSRDVYRVGVVAHLQSVTQLPNGSTRILLEGLGAVSVSRVASHKGALVATLVEPREIVAPDAADEATARQMLQRFEEYASLTRRIPVEVVQFATGSDDLYRTSFLLAAHLNVRTPVRQRLLESPTLKDLLTGLNKVLAGELEMLALEKSIDDEVRGSIHRNQREFYLQEQLRVINRELGNDDGDDLSEVATAVETADLPEDVRTRADKELRKLRRMSPMSPEATVIRNYLDWILTLPWVTEKTLEVAPGTMDVAHTRDVLNADHHGLRDVKERILDHVAVLANVGKMDGPMLCLVGPPGVGKTSLGRSIARALGRKFVRMSLGGVHDEAEIRGHRRTYIGSMPGRILQGMRRAGSVNPVMLLDEIDKLGRDHRGDPGSALLEVLDPEQNKTFNDHYLELDYDLSQVFFITTANTLGGIPDALRDRLEIVRLPGYLETEKLAIAREFLLPRQCERAGIAMDSVKLDPDVLPKIIRYYTREAGVRDLERQLARLTRKIARRRAEAAEGAEPSDTILSTDLTAMLGVAPFDPDEDVRQDQVGVSTGLAYTSVGGEVLDIEVSVVPGRGRLQLTGALGDVMKESAGAALTYARSRADQLGLQRDFHKTRDIHIHIPDGATPKDGPSAGIAIATALISALTNVPVRASVAMTGEITLRGRVLPIGGLKEKAVAALRTARTDVIVPERNARELDELPIEVKNGIRFHPVSSMDQVLELALNRTGARSTSKRRDGRAARSADATPPTGKVLPVPTPPPSTH